MTIKQKIEMYGFKGALRRQALLVLIEAVSNGKRVDDVQLIVENQGQRIGILEKKK